MNTTTNTRGVSPCPECGGAGVYPKAAVVPPPPDVTCRKCQGSGRDYHALSAQNTRGVSEAMVERAKQGWRNSIETNGQGASFDTRIRAALEAALSAEPAAQGEEGFDARKYIRNLAEVLEIGGDMFKVDADLARLGAAITAITAPPAQPAERVPEEITPEEVVARSMGGCQWGLSGAITFARGWNACRDAMLTATPAAPAEEGDGRPSDCSGDPSSCPDNEGRGCYCSTTGAALRNASGKEVEP